MADDGGWRRRVFAVALFLWGLTLSVSCVALRLEAGSKQTLEVQKHLKRLNKTPVKSIQLRPNYHPEGLFDENKVASTPAAKERVNPINQLWHQIGKCPENTIPVRRTKSDDILRASSVKRYGRKKHRAIPQPRSANPDLVNQNGHQVSPDLYGDNNTRLFTYWTEHVIQIERCIQMLGPVYLAFSFPTHVARESQDIF
ncbi:hypothetical protein SAY86_002851 [Trapa natans]|uniref:Neprosin activation peptide domain-containing protein n=1 Tax=Trapa natans TaxID=22666 RepID=A0AAN7LGD1_TRANT|nr:hypothetical protein SAY86_002851 [Trapa natans]